MSFQERLYLIEYINRKQDATAKALEDAKAAHSRK